MKSKFSKYKKEAISLRLSGKTYGGIKISLGVDIPKSTLSNWFNGLDLSVDARNKLSLSIKKNIKKAQRESLRKRKEKRDVYMEKLNQKMIELLPYLKNKDIAKIALAALYLGEGLKNRRGSLVFGNSNSGIIRLYLKLLRFCYDIDERKFRCTVQCRADQNVQELENFWMNVTGIEKDKFYKAQVDQRTIGKKTKKKEYKGVCRIDYFSAEVYNEINVLMNIVCK